MDALVEGLALWPGGLLIVSHDQVRFVDRVSRMHLASHDDTYGGTNALARRSAVPRVSC